MARTVVQHGSGRTAMGLAAAVLVVVTLLPRSWLGWVAAMSNAAERLVIPVQAPVEAGLRWLVGRGGGEAGAESPALQDALEQAELFRTLYRQSQEEAARLRNLVDDLTAGRAVGMGMGGGIVQVPAPVVGRVGSGSDILKVRAGREEGVSAGDVVTWRGVHIVGRVLPELDGKFCRVQALADRSAGGANLEGRGRITGVIFIGAPGGGSAEPGAGGAGAGAPRVLCLLGPTGDGRLSGDVAASGSGGSGGAGVVTVGATVRLSDERWPASAQMLVLGTVTSVETKPNQRQVVTVTPAYDLRTVREVVVRASGAVESAGGGP